MASKLALSLHDQVHLTTTKGENVKGSVHALDEQTHTLVLRLPGPDDSNGTTTTGGHLLRFLPTKTIKHIELLPSTDTHTHTHTSNGAGSAGDISTERLAKLEKEARGKAAREMAKINPAATPKGQMSFDHISKIYSDTRWSGTSIIIMDQVRIDPPYTRTDTHTLDASVKSEFIDRLAAMLERADKKLEAAGKK